MVEFEAVLATYLKELNYGVMVSSKNFSVLITLNQDLKIFPNFLTFLTEE